MRARRTDTVHKDVLRALKMLGLPYRDLSATGGGVQDLLVGVPSIMTGGLRMPFPSWLLVEVKTPQNKRGTVKPSQFTNKQREWYAKSAGFPRLVVTGFEDAVEKLREMMGS